MMALGLCVAESVIRGSFVTVGTRASLFIGRHGIGPPPILWGGVLSYDAGRQQSTIYIVPCNAAKVRKVSRSQGRR